MKRCKTCKHWTGKPDQNGYRECALTVTSDGCLAHVRNPAYPLQLADRWQSKAFALDGEVYSAALLTAADFGCTEHKP